MGDVRIAAKSTLTTLNRWIEVISGNLAGSNIYGYKGTRISFGDSLVDVLRSGTGTTTAGGLNPIQVGVGGISVGATSTDFRQGSLIQTGDNNHMAIQGNAFFVTADAAGKITYTRNGEFHFDDQGNYVTNDGGYVLGIHDISKKIIVQDFLDPYSTAGTTGINAGAGPTLAGAAAIDVVDAANATVITDADAITAMGTIFTPASATTANLTHFLDNQTTGAFEDRMIFTGYISGTGKLSVGGTTDGPVTLFSLDTGGGAVSIDLQLNTVNNPTTNTAYDNAKLIANAVNARSAETGVGCSVIRDKNNPDGRVSFVLAHVERTLSEDQVAFTSTTDVTADLVATRAGVLSNVTDNKGNLYHRVNIKTLTSSFPTYTPLAGDKFSFDATGQLINNSRGKDAASAPPLNSGVHIAINKFSNADGLLKSRGSSLFQYTDAAGNIITGFAGMEKGRALERITGREINGVSTIGTENLIVPQALEASNTSVTEMLPELTVAQKTFTSNTKVVNVGNTIVDDLNGLIR